MLQKVRDALMEREKNVDFFGILRTFLLIATIHSWHHYLLRNLLNSEVYCTKFQKSAAQLSSCNATN